MICLNVTCEFEHEANKVPNENKLKKSKSVPLTEAIKCFNNYIPTKASEAIDMLRKKYSMHILFCSNVQWGKNQ